MKGKDTPGSMRSRAIRMSSGDVARTPTNSSFFGKLGTGVHHGSFMDGSADETNSLIEKLNTVKEELQITQESFISRERAYKIRIDELEDQLAKKRKEKIGWMDTDPTISKLKNEQAKILSNVALVQDRFARVVREQEQDLLRAFQARLLDVQAELELQKSKKDDGAVAYIELSKTKEYDVEKEKVKADLKERQNQALLQSNNRLKSQFASREEDRNYLVMQINMARTDNARLRSEFTEHEAENKKLKAQVAEQAERLANAMGAATSSLPSRKNLTSAQTLQMKIDAEERFKEVNARLRKLLAEERRSLQQVRQNYNNEISSRTDLELILRDCVEEVRKEGERRRADFSKYATKKLQVQDDNDPEQQRRDRERVLELMLSKEQVVSLIYAKSGVGAVPKGPSSPLKTATTLGGTGSPNSTALDETAALTGILDLNFGLSNPSWTSGSAVQVDSENASPHPLSYPHPQAHPPQSQPQPLESELEGSSQRGDFASDKLPAIAPLPGRR